MISDKVDMLRRRIDIMLLNESRGQSCTIVDCYRKCIEVLFLFADLSAFLCCDNQ